MLPALHVFNIDARCIRVCMRRIFAPGQARQNVQTEPIDRL